MSRKAMEAAQLLENDLLGELFAEYRQALYMKWEQELNRNEARTLRAQARSTHELSGWIRNKCLELIDGT